MPIALPSRSAMPPSMMRPKMPVTCTMAKIACRGEIEPHAVDKACHRDTQRLAPCAAAKGRPRRRRSSRMRGDMPQRVKRHQQVLRREEGAERKTPARRLRSRVEAFARVGWIASVTSSGSAAPTRICKPPVDQRERRQDERTEHAAERHAGLLDGENRRAMALWCVKRCSTSLPVPASEGA